MEARPQGPLFGDGMARGNAEALGVDLGFLDAAAARLRKQVDAGKLPGFASCVVKAGKVVHFDVCGYADADTKEPLKIDTLFRLFSQTKPVTIVAFMRLWERGLVHLEDPIFKFIPAFADAVVGEERSAMLRPITIRDLLAHTSGIGFGPGFGHEPNDHYEKPYADLVGRVDRGEVPSLAAWCDELAQVPLLFQPGSDWGYGYSSDVLGRVAEVVSGRPLDELLRTEVLSPLGMDETAFAVPAAKARRLAALHSRDPCDGSGKHVEVAVADPGGAAAEGAAAGGSPSSVFLEGRSSPVLQGGGCVSSMAGGLTSCLGDYARFGQMLLGGGELEGVRLLRPETVRLLAEDWLNGAGAEARDTPLWVWETPGLGFSPFGQVGVSHPDAPARRTASSHLNTVYWGGAGGSSYMLSWPHQLMVLTYTGCIYDTATQEAMWRAVFKSLRPRASASTRNRFRSVQFQLCRKRGSRVQGRKHQPASRMVKRKC